MPEPSPDHVVSPEHARAQLDRILASAAFSRTERLSRFLRVIGDRVLAGEGDQLKEYVVGVEVFDRPASFDPRLDSVVRVQAQRLRARLQAYYEGEGRHDAVIVELPKGGYVPQFAYRTDPAAGDLRPGTDGAVAAPPAVRHRRRVWVAGVLVVAAALLALGAWRWWPPSAPVVPGLSKVAVLPFDNLSTDAGNEYFCVGLVEELRTALARVDGLRVVSRLSIATSDGAGDPVALGRRLHADVLVAGSVRTSGGRVRVAAQVVSAADGTQLWAQTYERQAADTFAIQDEIAGAIAAALRREVGGPAAVRSPHGPRDATAHASYLRAVFHRNRLTPDDLRQSIAFAEQTVAYQPDYAAAHAILADACATLAFRESVSERGLIDRARAAAARAIELDDRLADAHATLAWIRFFDDWDARAAEAGFTRALQIDPSAARTLSWLSQTLMAVGRHDAAIEAARRALDAEPLSYRLSTTLALVLYNARRFDEAAAQARRALALAPDDFLAHTALGLASWQAGRTDEARTALRASLASLPDSTETLAYLAHIDARTGQAARARSVLARLERPPDGNPPAPAYQRALVHAALGDADRALACLAEALGRHETDLPYLGVDPLFDPIRADPRLGALVSRIGVFGG